MEFEWALSKEEANIRKHGHSFSEAVESFKDPFGVQLIDEQHSGREERYYWVGKIKRSQSEDGAQQVGAPIVNVAESPRHRDLG